MAPMNPGSTTSPGEDQTASASFTKNPVNPRASQPIHYPVRRRVLLAQSCSMASLWSKKFLFGPGVKTPDGVRRRVAMSKRTPSARASQSDSAPRGVSTFCGGDGHPPW